MRKAVCALSGLMLLGAFAHTTRALETTSEYSVQAGAIVHEAPARITLHWPQDTCSRPKNYSISRKAAGAAVWGKPVTVPGTATEYVDNKVVAGSVYEYQVVKNTPDYVGYGYVCAGIKAPLVENRGRLLLVVENKYADDLCGELNRLTQDLVGDGWLVTRLDVKRDDSVASVKKKIKSQYLADPANVKAVFLFGHVPVAYSGDIAPDGHVPAHQGAWPCDGYYGDMDGEWTDTSVKTVVAAEPRNRNVPGDGKFDQSSFPARLKLMVGRVDLSNMPGRLSYDGPATFPDELQLLRNYLNKDHAFRHKQFDLPRRGVVGDYFGVRDGEAFAASGWRNLSSFFDAENVACIAKQGKWISNLSSNSYLWAYGCGPGSFTSIGGLGNSDSYNDGVTTELYKNDPKAAFTLLFGSWLGDWDSEDNFQRAVLALPSYGLTCACSGRPHWFLHHMALGEPIGYSTRLTQNNGPDGLYRNQLNNCAGQIHIALMGDPTLRMHVVAPPMELTGTAERDGLRLHWSAANDDVAGYHVYRAASPNGPFARLNEELVTGTTYADQAPGSRATYMVRAVKLETSASGTYFNASQGAFVGSGESTPAAITSNGRTKIQPAASETATPAPTGDAKSSIREIPSPEQGTNAAPRALQPTGLTAVTNDTIWVNDALPAGAVGSADGGDSWTWVTSNPSPYSGASASQSTIRSGLHQHYFMYATQTLAVNSGETLVAYAWLDPNNLPSEIMLQWYNGSWEHRAYWGSNSITYGDNGSNGRRNMGGLPPAGQWVRLEVPASQVGLEGSTLSGMAFTTYNGRATWDAAGKAAILITNPGSGTNTSTGTTNSSPGVTNTPAITATTNASIGFASNSVPGVNAIDYTALALPPVGTNALHVISPNVLELKYINTKAPDPARVAQWDLVDANGNFVPPPTSAFTVLANGQPVGVTSIGFKRRALYAPFLTYDLRIENSLYLQLNASIPDNAVVEVRNPSASLWPAMMQFITTASPLRFSPAIHVNQEGYMPGYPKKAMVGHYVGSLGELTIPTSAGFQLVDANTGAQVYQGALTSRGDIGWTYSLAPYQKVYEADFTGFNTPGQYRLVVPGLGGSLPFVIDGGIAMDFTRAYALGLYHQRCGTATAMPYTRFTHDKCHSPPASVPWPASSYPFTWTTVANYGLITNPDNPVQRAPAINAATQLFPFQRQGTLDTTGGHHDAGDYSKYTINSASLIHYLMFAVDSLPGVAALDNLGIPESGDGISDVMQEAKWEADFLAKIQDTDGGFYFLVYPVNREYESTLPGDPQVVWPKTTSVTAAAVAALAQCASSPAFKQAYPATAAMYLQKAQLGWQFLTNAINRYGRTGAYQKITHYGDNFADQDELAWAACQMYLATGNQSIHQMLLSWFDPANPATWRYGWIHLPECYGHAIRSYAFAVRSGRFSSNSQLDATFLAKCQNEITTAGDMQLGFYNKSAYGTSFPDFTKAVRAAGWYFSSDQAYDMSVAYQLNPRPEYINAILGNMNYEGGCNPVNVAYITGMGWKRQREIVNQWAASDTRVLPPTGIPVGNMQASFVYLSTYGTSVEGLVYPGDDAGWNPYPYYDRWTDGWNVTAEMVILNSAKALGSLAFLAAQTPLKTQAWHSVSASVLNLGTGADGKVTLGMSAPGVDLSGARLTWEVANHEPAFGSTYSFAPDAGSPWIEVEAQWPDGRRVFATTNLTLLAGRPAQNPVWMDDALPLGAAPGSDGGDAWNWVSAGPSPQSGSKAVQSSIAAGQHQLFFMGASVTMSVATGDTLYAWVYLDPVNPPSEVMLQWNDGSSWEHRAYWGANSITYGVDGTAGRRAMGARPAVGQWVQLKVPASQVGLEGKTVSGMAFSLYGGRATWDNTGTAAAGTTPATTKPSLSLQVNNGTPLLSWNSTAGSVYQVRYKTNFGDLTWITAATVTATNSTTTWSDQSSHGQKQRCYQVLQTQ